MPRGTSATKEVEQDEDDPALFPELEKDNPEHKELLKRARKYAKEEAARKILLNENKAMVDGLMDRLIEQMHTCDMTKFKYGDIQVEVVPGKEKAKVKIATDDDEDDDDEAGDSDDENSDD